MIGQCLSKLIVITLLICTINLAIANEHSDLVSYVPSYAFFNHDRTVAVSTQKKRKGTQVFVFLKSDEQFIKLDISAVEGMNLGKLGRHSLDYYDRVSLSLRSGLFVMMINFKLISKHEHGKMVEE